MLKIFVTLLALFAFPVHAIAQDESTITVAILDTGVSDVGALKGRIDGHYDLYKVDRPREKIVSSHGTMVANIIAAQTGDNVRFIDMRVDRNRCLGDICEVDEMAIQRALRLAIELRVDMIQASLSGKMHHETRDLFILAANEGIEVVLAAGNHAGTSLAGTILKESNGKVHIVSSLDAKGHPSEFSARMRGSLRDQMIWRVGEDVPTIDFDGKPTTATGTSFAAPSYASEIILARAGN